MPSAATRQELASEALRSFGTVRLRVVGGSMLPTLWPGDIVTVSARPDVQIRAGDIVAFAPRAKIIGHRLIGRTAENGWLLTRGDRCRQDDPPVPPAEVLGVVTRILRDSREIPVRSVETCRNRCVAWILRHSDLATHLI